MQLMLNSRWRSALTLGQLITAQISIVLQYFGGAIIILINPRLAACGRSGGGGG